MGEWWASWDGFGGFEMRSLDGWDCDGVKNRPLSRQNRRWDKRGFHTDDGLDRCSPQRSDIAHDGILVDRDTEQHAASKKKTIEFDFSFLRV